jgi:hypothetical protein
MNKLKNVATEILDILDKRRQELELTFVEDTHTYTMKNSKGELKSDWPSVSKVMKLFYTEFDSEGISLRKANGDTEIQQQLLEEWKAAADYSINVGSRTHFLLEKKSLEIFEINKEVRQPIFDCDFEQILKSDSMVSAGTDFLETMKERGALLLDTELILGDDELGYTGAPDKMWLIENKDKTEIGIICTDYKTNKPKNFEASYFTKKMKYPFEKLDDTALGHYSTQLPFYCKLLLKMLKGSKYENIKVYGCIIVLVKDNGMFEEFRIPKEVQQTILDMDMKQYLTKQK